MPEELEQRKEEITASADLSGLLARLAERARPLLDRMPMVPRSKALLSSDGGICPDDHAPLVFDPWTSERHRCSRCGREWTGERHDRWWARFQHLWLAERAAQLAAVGAFASEPRAAERAREILRAYGERYLEYPNADNVLGPSRLFFSTYLESIWITNFLAAAVLLRSAGELDDATAEQVSRVADEAANLIGEFDEGFSNRQTWHSAALLAIAVWFEDEELAARAIESETGLVAHLLNGFGPDGMWYEGENYHLFALQGLLSGLAWARAAGVDLIADPELAARLYAALRAPCLSALPDFTFPARKDSRFGVSLAQPMYLELWETGRGALAGTPEDTTDLADWLAGLYRTPAPVAQTLDSCLHEAGEPASGARGRADLSWRALLDMPAELAGDAERWKPASTLFVAQGLAILREGERYASLECGSYGGGHGHPDRLHLTLFASGVHWLRDFGTGTYVSPDLFWYRSTLAHNAPRLDGRSQPAEDATCDAFDSGEGWGWAHGEFGQLTRTIVSGPGYLVDVVELESAGERLLELPWHPAGTIELDPPAAWEPATLDDRFATGAERVTGGASAPTVLRCRAGDARLGIHLIFDGDLLRASAPDAPGTERPATFYLQRSTGGAQTFVAVLDTSPAQDAVRSVHVEGGVVSVEGRAGVERHSRLTEGWIIETGDRRIRLGGRRVVPPRFEPLLQTRIEPMSGVAMAVHEPPALDGTLDGFEQSEPLLLDHDDQYRRSEEPYAGAEEFSAAAWISWDDGGLYVAVRVTKADPTFRPADAEPLRLDNDPDDIHSDGIQIYLRGAGAECGTLIVPEAGGMVRARPVEGEGDCVVDGAWSATDDGYLVTAALRPAEWTPVTGEEIGFDLIVNEMHAGRQRRAGQLVWSGGGGWVWLRGDRQDPSRFGRLELR